MTAGLPNTCKTAPFPAYYNLMIIQKEITQTYILSSTYSIYIRRHLTMLADLVHFARCVVAIDNTTYIIITFSPCR
jgi:hypothetical protein